MKVVNHVVALLAEGLEVAESVRNAPESPVTSYLPARMRRTWRRNANRLRDRRLQPRHLNLYTAEDLAVLLERTAARDEAIERGLDKLTRIVDEVHRVFEYQRAELEEGTRIVYSLAQQRAQEDGPDSKAAEFFRLFQQMIAQGHEIATLKRRQKEPAPVVPFTLPGADPVFEIRERISAAEILREPPGSDERVLHFPPGATDSVEPPVVMRIGIGDHAWVGSFARGTTAYCTVQLMPDQAHLLVVACGAGYLLEVVTRSLVSEAGKDIVEVRHDDETGLLVIDRAVSSILRETT